MFYYVLYSIINFCLNFKVIGCITASFALLIKWPLSLSCVFLLTLDSIEVPYSVILCRIKVCDAPPVAMATKRDSGAN